MKYVIFKTPSFGYAGAVITPKGIRRLYFGYENRRVLEHKIIKEFPNPRTADSKKFPEIINPIIAYFSGRKINFNFKLDLSWTTPFQKKVYLALLKIRYGEKISYSKLARHAGCPGGARPAGTSMAKNQIPILIPCHRVIRNDGRPGGFSAPGGIKTKIRLLKLEGK